MRTIVELVKGGPESRMSPKEQRQGSRKIIPITDLKPGQKAIITLVRGNRKVTQRLADLGLTPETSISILKSAPFNGPIEVAVRGSKLAIGREIAENIMVQSKGT